MTGCGVSCSCWILDTLDGYPFTVDRFEPCAGLQIMHASLHRDAGVAGGCILRHALIAQDCADISLHSHACFPQHLIEAGPGCRLFRKFSHLHNSNLVAVTEQGHVSDCKIAELLPSYWHLAIQTKKASHCLQVPI